MDKRKTYTEQIDKIINSLDKDITDSSTLDDTQVELDRLADKYRFDEDLGTARYKLYQAQAMIHERVGNNEEALIWIIESEKVRGERYSFSEEFIDRLDQQPYFTPKTTQQKIASVLRWIIVCVGVLEVLGGRNVIVIVVWVLIITLALYFEWMSNIKRRVN